MGGQLPAQPQPPGPNPQGDVVAGGTYWPGLDSLGRVQELLDQNKLLLTEIAQNHDLRTPDALQRNVVLIRQLNTNITEVVRHYSELASLVGDEAQDGAPAQDQGGSAGASAAAAIGA